MRHRVQLSPLVCGACSRDVQVTNEPEAVGRLAGAVA